MLAPTSRHQQAACGEAGQPDAMAFGGDFGSTFGRKEFPMNASTCVFWCAVALGALVKGSPIESVSTFLLD